MVVNLFLILVAAGFLWYIVQSQNLLGEKKTAVSSTKQAQTDIQFKDKKITLDYKKFDPKLIENIGTFSRDEKWLGSGFYDTALYFEYPSSLNLAGGERNKITMERNNNLDLSKIINFDLIINFQSELTDLETGDLTFVDSNKKTAVFVLPTTQSAKNWVAINIPKEQFATDSDFNWNRIEKTRFNFLPRLFASVVVGLGGLRGQPGSILYNDWNTIDEKMLLLDKRKNEISLMVRNIGASVAVIRKITSVSNFTFQSSYSPLNSGLAGLFFRGNYKNGQGYYLLVGGIGGNQWQITKTGKDGSKILALGEINNFQFKYGEKYYLKADTKGNNIKAYLSTDGSNFTLLASTDDDEFTSGGVGLVTNGGVALFNDFEFTQ